MPGTAGKLKAWIIYATSARTGRGLSALSSRRLAPPLPKAFRPSLPVPGARLMVNQMILERQPYTGTARGYLM
jgi:hypothetical protein